MSKGRLNRYGASAEGRELRVFVDALRDCLGLGPLSERDATSVWTKTNKRGTERPGCMQVHSEWVGHDRSMR
jgi:hypothetical protein